jgi:hypothetical protein
LKRASTLEWLREGLGIIAANISKAGWSWGANQPLIQRGEQSGLRTHREDNQRFVVHADGKADCVFGTGTGDSRCRELC